VASNSQRTADSAVIAASASRTGLPDDSVLRAILSDWDSDARLTTSVTTSASARVCGLRTPRSATEGSDRRAAAGPPVTPATRIGASRMDLPPGCGVLLGQFPLRLLQIVRKVLAVGVELLLDRLLVARARLVELRPDPRLPTTINAASPASSVSPSSFMSPRDMPLLKCLPGSPTTSTWLPSWNELGRPVHLVPGVGDVPAIVPMEHCRAVRGMALAVPFRVQRRCACGSGPMHGLRRTGLVSDLPGSSFPDHGRAFGSKMAGHLGGCEMSSVARTRFTPIG
jgi:hypothetical protein